jgi:CHAT domain-containing protein
VVVDIEQEEVETLASSFVRLTSGEAELDRGVQDTGEKLSRMLLAPYSDLDGEYETLVIVPDGILFSIPWSALPFRGGHLVDDHVITIEPSASVFVHLNGRPPRQRTPSALLVANPPGPHVVGGTRPRPLPEAEKEAADLERLLSRTTTLVGKNATEDQVRARAGEHDIIHFGTHAWIVTESPLRSSLLLAGMENEVADPHLMPVAPSDGILTGYEVLSLEMKPQAMVTLAACESVGRGRRRGEGVAGLARAFFEAGAGTVIATLWPVDDRSTRELMVRFYRELALEGKSTAAALAAAQAALSRGEAGRRRQHPFNWAGFVLIGDGR